MSDYKAIAAVSVTLNNLLNRGMIDEQITPPVMVTVQPPDAIELSKSSTDTINFLNIFLYQITTNNYYDNSLPTRNSEGDVIRRPRLALNLHYILTAFDSKNEDVNAQLILGCAMRVLNEYSILPRKLISDSILHDPRVVDSNLADQIELVKITLQSLTLEEITKLWASFFKTNYRTSIAYQVTVILLDGKQDPAITLPVRERSIHVTQNIAPIINSVMPHRTEKNANTIISITGENLNSDDPVRIKFGDLIITPEHITNDNILVKIPDGLAAGMTQLQVLHVLNPELPSMLIIGSSNIANFELVPTIEQPVPDSVKRGQKLSIQFSPDVTSEQKMELLIGTFTIPIPLTNLIGHTHNLDVKIPDTIPIGGPYFLKLKINGIESILQSKKDVPSDDPDYGKFIGPVINITA